MVTEQEQGKSRSASRRRAGADSRRQAILEMLSGDSDGSVTVEEISRALSVSLATVRRDLAALRAEKLITRTYGGAALGTPAAELPDQVGFWHRDDVAVLVARYERLRA